MSAAEFSFDVVADGIREQTAQSVQFESKTTGDRDGLDLVLDDASSGRLIFDSAAGVTELNLAELTAPHPRKVFEFGGVDMELVVERYPAEVTETSLGLIQDIRPEKGERTPYFVKATQVDGQMAWASPIYVGEGG